MPELRMHNFSISLDGYVAGPDQSPDDPLGVGGEALHEWLFAEGSGDDPAVAELLAKRAEDCGATIMGRNMFGPIRREWPDENWRGWWGEDPPFHHPVFVLTHYPRAPIEMAGGTTFSFVTDGIESAYRQAAEAAGGTGPSASAAARRSPGNTCVPDWWTRSTWSWCRSCCAAASACSTGSTRRSKASARCRSCSRPRASRPRRTSGCAGRADAAPGGRAVAG